MYFKRLTIFLFFITLCLVTTAQKAILWGKVVRVADGDTITLLDSLNQQHSIRLHGIDCPERTQDYFQVAKDFTGQFCANKLVRADVYSYDQYKRAIARVYVDSTELNYALLKTGLAWHFTQFDKTTYYAEAEAEAKMYKRQLWSLPNPIAPWEFRKWKKQQRQNSKAKN